MNHTPKWFTRKAFRTYLESLGGTARFLVRNSSKCPIACFVRAVTSAYQVDVGFKVVHFDSVGRHVEFELPKWAIDYIQRIDGLNPLELSRDEALRHALA